MSDDNKQTVGAQLPDRLFQLLNLNALAEGTSKSQIIRDSLLLWLDYQEIEIEQVLDKLAKEYADRWRRKKHDNPEASKSEFHYEIEEELSGKKVNPYYINLILERI